MTTTQTCNGITHGQWKIGAYKVWSVTKCDCVARN